MTTTELIRPAGPASPSFGEMLAEILPLVGFIPVAGPAAILLAVPWLLLALMLVGYVALLLTVGGVLVLAAALVGLVRELVASLHRLVRDIGAHRVERTPAPRLAVSGSR
jgi:hypothetical protein